MELQQTTIHVESLVEWREIIGKLKYDADFVAGKIFMV